MDFKSFVSSEDDGLQEFCVVSQQETLAAGNRAGKVVNVHQKQKGAHFPAACFSFATLYSSLLWDKE